MLTKLKRYQFLFEELVKRDFTKKYKLFILSIQCSFFENLFCDNFIDH